MRTRKNILITGGEGFIGANFVRHLCESQALNNDFNIIILDRKVKKFTALDHLLSLNPKYNNNIERIAGYIQDEKLVDSLIARSEYVVNLAANTGVQNSLSDPIYDATSNILSVLNILESCKKHHTKRLVLISSGAPTGSAKPPVSETSTTQPLSPYGCSKLAGESYANAYHKCFGVPVTVLRFSNIYGPYCLHKSSVVSKFLKSAISEKVVSIYGSLDNCRDYLYVDDVSNALSKALLSDYDINGKVIQLGTGVPTALEQLVKSINIILVDKNLKSLSYKIEGPLPGDIPKTWTDPSQAKILIDWEAKAPFLDSLDATLNYLLISQDLLPS